MAYNRMGCMAPWGLLWLHLVVKIEIASYSDKVGTWMKDDVGWVFQRSLVWGCTTVTFQLFWSLPQSRKSLGLGGGPGSVTEAR